jgi:two-component system, chemotaxis family, protein-glutamate methylesterase/glutaminase
VAFSAPDVILLDIEMPVMDGITALPLLLRARPGAKVLVVSALSQRNAEISFRALALAPSTLCRNPTPISTSRFCRSFAPR